MTRSSSLPIIRRHNLNNTTTCNSSYFRSTQSAVTCNYVTTIAPSSGLYFDKLLDVKFINNAWKVITYLDVGHINPNLEKVELLIEKVSLFCNSMVSSKINSDCTNSLATLKHQHVNNINKFSSVSYLLSEESSRRRSRRGLIDFGGSLLKTFFGTMDSEDAVKYSNAINDVQSDEKKLAHLMKDNIHVIKNTISSFNQTLSKVNLNEQHLMKNMEIIHDILDKVTNNNDKLEIKSQINSLFQSIESIILTLSFDIDDVNNAILFSKLNILHPTVLSPYQLYNELDKNRNSLPKHSELPVPLTIQNIHELIDISKIICYYHLNRIIVIINIPLVLPQVYNLYNVIPSPAPYDISKPDTFALIAPSSSYLAITADHMFYSPITDINQCKVISEKCFICELVNVYSTIANPTCETTLLTELVNKLPDSCNIKLIHGLIDVFHKITNNRWIFVQSEPGKCHVTCGDEAESSEVILFGTGILTLPKDCRAFYKTLQFVPNSEIVTKNITKIISNFDIIIDDCCEKTKLNKTINKLPFTKLDNVNNLNSLLHASIHLDSLEEQLSKLETPSHFERFGMHYMSLSYISSILLILYLIYRYRKIFCTGASAPATCCIKIFNQCNNRRTTHTPNRQIVIAQDVRVDSSSEEGDHPVSPSPARRNIFMTRSLSRDDKIN